MRCPAIKGAPVCLACPLVFVVCLIFGSFEAWALPPGFSRTQVASGLSRPTAMAFAPDGRLFVLERGTGSGGTGRLRVIKNGTLVSQPVLSIVTDNASVSANERGLLGIALDPSFASNGFVYLYYTVRSPVHNRVSRFTVTGDRADPASEMPLLDLEGLGAGNHNGGPLLFGRDGKLYVGVGENARASNSASLNNHLGKILRINKDGSVPADNPFFQAGGGDTARDRIWALGLRNPFSTAVHPASGRIFVNDVGQSSWEEINDLVRGKNYGWTGGSSDGDSTAFFRYPASLGKCIAGGAFYAAASPPGNFSRFADHYFYGDYQAGWVRAINVNSKAVTVFDTGLRGPVDVEVAADGSVYMLTHQGGEVFRVTSSGGGGPGPQNIVPSLAALDLREGTSSSFTVELATAPTANVTVAVAKASGDGSISVSPASLTFTAANWNRPQAVQVMAAQDPDRTTDSAVVTLTAPGLTTRRVSVNAIDDDTPLAVVITAPHAGDIVSGAALDFYGGVDGQGSKGEFFIDGALAYTDQGPGHYHFGGGHGGWDSTDLADGRHNLRLMVTDAAGNTGSHQISVTVRNASAFIDPDDPGDPDGQEPGDVTGSASAACGGGDPGVAAGCVLLVGLAWRRRRR